jgi:hypothetical protein
VHYLRPVKGWIRTPTNYVGILGHKHGDNKANTVYKKEKAKAKQTKG